MQRFYIADLVPQIQEFVVDDHDLIHQFSRVMRAKVWDKCVVFNGDGYEYVYEVASIEKRSILLTYIEKHKNTYHPKLSLTLCQALPNKWDKCEQIVQKGVEIGIESFVFFGANRSQVHDIPEKKRIRLQKIAIESTEQSGRPHPPTIEVHTSFPSSKGQSLVLDFSGEPTKTIIWSINNDVISIFVGPEWGWSDTERIQFWKWDYEAWSLWDSVLRTETAWICASFCLLQMS